MLDFQHARIDWIDRNHYTQGTRVAVEEKAVGGEGKVTFESLPEIKGMTCTIKFPNHG